MKQSIVGFRFPLNSAREELIVIDLADKTSIVRSQTQIEKDLTGSGYTLSVAESLRNKRLQLVDYNDFTDGEVSSNFEWKNKGTSFKATREYADSLAAMKAKGLNAIRSVIVDGKTVDKVPIIGDEVIKSTDGYVNNGFLKLKPNESYAIRNANSKQYAKTMLEVFGGHIAKDEAPVASPFTATM